MNTLTNDTLTLLLHEYVQMLVLQCFHLIFSLIILAKMGMELELTFTLFWLKLCLTYVILENIYLLTTKTLYQYWWPHYSYLGGWTIIITVLILQIWYLILWSNPLLERTLLNNSLELLKTILSDDNLFYTLENTICEALYNVRWMVWVHIDV